MISFTDILRRALIDKDYDALAAIYAPNAVIYSSITGERSMIEDVILVMQGMHKAITLLELQVMHEVTTKTDFAASFLLSGKSNGTGDPITIPAAVLYRHADGVVHTAYQHMDAMALCQATGSLPENALELALTGVMFEPQDHRPHGQRRRDSDL